MNSLTSSKVPHNTIDTVPRTTNTTPATPECMHCCQCVEPFMIIIRYRMVPVLRTAEEKASPTSASVTASQDVKVGSPKKTAA